MLEVAPKTIFSSHLVVSDETRQRGQITSPFLLPHSLHATTFELDGVCYRPSHSPHRKARTWLHLDVRLPWNDECALYVNGEPIAHAKRHQTHIAGVVSTLLYDVKFEGSLFRLVTEHAELAPRTTVFEKSAHTEDEAKAIGSIYAPGRVITRRVIDLPERLPIFVQVYLFWLSRSLKNLGSSHV